MHILKRYQVVKYDFFYCIPIWLFFMIPLTNHLLILLRNLLARENIERMVSFFPNWVEQICTLLDSHQFSYTFACKILLYEVVGCILVSLRPYVRLSVRQSVRPASRVRSVAPTCLIRSISYLYI